MMDRRLHQIEEGFERELAALLGSVNFSGYTDRARLRSDDLEVRNAASRYVLEAKQLAAAAISGWWNATVPEPTREQPFPDPNLSKKLRNARAFEQALADLETAIRSAVAPDLDAVWNLRADGPTLLAALVAIDGHLLQASKELATVAGGISASDVDAETPFANLQKPLAEIRSIVSQRTALLSNA